MIVWVCSYPRSGNTFLRIVLKHLFGLRTSVVYDVDGVAERVGHELVGYTDTVASIEAMRASPEVHFVKTHRQRDADVDEADPAICLVRDGRDSVVSWARLLSEAEPARFETEMRALIDRRDTIGTGSWGQKRAELGSPASPQPGDAALRGAGRPAAGGGRSSSGADAAAATATRCPPRCTRTSSPARTTARPCGCWGTNPRRGRAAR